MRRFARFGTICTFKKREKHPWLNPATLISVFRVFYVGQIIPNLRIKKRLQKEGFPITIAKFLRTATLKNICEQLLPPQTYVKEMLSRKRSLLKWIPG